MSHVGTSDLFEEAVFTVIMFDVVVVVVAVVVSDPLFSFFTTFAILFPLVVSNATFAVDFLAAVLVCVPTIEF